MHSPQDSRPLRRLGFPIRRSPDQRLLSGSPKLIAACHVLRRLLAPRHPPCALSSLTSIERATTLESSRLPTTQYAVFKDRAGGRPASTHRAKRYAVHPQLRSIRRCFPKATASLLPQASTLDRSCYFFLLRYDLLATISRRGAEGGRTLDLRLAKPALSQLSYSPRTLRRSTKPFCSIRHPRNGGPR